MKSNRKMTLGDRLSSAVKTVLARLRDDLGQQAQATSQDQPSMPEALRQQARRVAVAPTLATPQRPNKKPHRPAPNKKFHRSRRPGKKTALRPIPVIRRQSPLFDDRKTQPTVRPALARSMRPDPKPFEFWALPPEAAVREPAPTSAPVQACANVDRLILAGSSPDTSRIGEELFVTIGLDFGTSSTKVIVRFPYESGTPTIAIPAPTPCQSKGQPYLWQTVLWLDRNGEFKPWPDPNAHLLYALKQGVVCAYPDGSLPGGATRAEAAAAFLAFVIRYTRGWLLEHRPIIFRRRQPVWFVNVGLPAANFDNAVLTSTYRRIGAAALMLANSQNAITVAAARFFLADPYVQAAALSPTKAEALGVTVIPETAAEVAGFAKSTSRAPGLYLMVDVGAMTLDVCSFRLHQRSNAGDLYALLLALVPPLGVESYYWFLGRGKTDDDFIEQTDHALRRVVWNTKLVRDPHAPCWKPGNDLPVFLVGGGAKHALHRRSVDALNHWLCQHAGNAGVRILELPAPANIELPEPISDFGRLAVAWGLSYPSQEIGDIIAPSALDNIAPPKPVTVADRFISKDQV